MNLTLSEVIHNIKPIDESIKEAAQKKWNKVAKPLGSLGLLESAVVTLAAASRREVPVIDNGCLIVCCGDNGVVAEGCTQVGSEVTYDMVKSLATGQCSVCAMARAADITVIPADFGILRPVNLPNIHNCRIANGTNNIAMGPAMSREQAIRGIMSGVSLAQQAKNEGAQILLTGELGIGNTTTSSAMASVLLNIDANILVGRGAGLSDEGLLRKQAIVKKAIEVNAPDANDPIDILSKLGGFDIAGMIGVILGGAFSHIPVVLDGVISCVAALIALRLAPEISGYLLASHQSAEPAGKLLLDALGLKAPIQAQMRLGEGTGAVALIPLLHMALAVYTQAATFKDVEIVSYEELNKGEKR